MKNNPLDLDLDLDSTIHPASPSYLRSTDRRVFVGGRWVRTSLVVDVLKRHLDLHSVSDVVSALARHAQRIS